MEDQTSIAPATRDHKSLTVEEWAAFDFPAAFRPIEDHTDPRWAEMLGFYATTDRCDVLTQRFIDDTPKERGSDYGMYLVHEAELVAQAYPCGVDGCSGEAHDEGALPAEWHHDIISDHFNGDDIDFDATLHPDGSVHGHLYMDSHGDMTAADLRAEAEIYEGYPAWLRTPADRLEARSAGVTA